MTELVSMLDSLSTTVSPLPHLDGVSGRGARYRASGSSPCQDVRMLGGLCDRSLGNLAETPASPRTSSRLEGGDEVTKPGEGAEESLRTV